MKKFQAVSLFLTIFLLIASSPFATIKGQMVYVAPTLPTIPDKTFNVKDFGAVGDNKTDNTKAINEAIKAATNAGGGKVVVPSGIYLSGPIQFTNNLN